MLVILEITQLLKEPEMLKIQNIVTKFGPLTIDQISEKYKEESKESNVEEVQKILDDLVQSQIIATTSKDEKYATYINIQDLKHSFLQKYEILEKAKQQVEATNNKLKFVMEIERLEGEIQKSEDSASKSQKYIHHLHTYNELKDITFALVEMISKKRGVAIKEVLEEFDVKDIENIKDM